MAMPSSRPQTDLKKLMKSDYKVDTTDDVHIFYVTFHGPTGSLYVGGVWKIRVELPPDYPSGSVCLDVISHKWNPTSDLVNIFDFFLPQLLLYPNPKDPFNEEAASLMMSDRTAYELTVKEYCKTHATPEGIRAAEEDANDDDDDSMSEHGPDNNDEIAGQADP